MSEAEASEEITKCANGGSGRRELSAGSRVVSKNSNAPLVTKTFPDGIFSDAHSSFGAAMGMSKPDVKHMCASAACVLAWTVDQANVGCGANTGIVVVVFLMVMIDSVAGVFLMLGVVLDSVAISLGGSHELSGELDSMMLLLSVNDISSFFLVSPSATK